MYNTLKCVETLGNVPSLIFKTLGQLENVTEPFRRPVYYAFTSPISFHSTSLEILSPSLQFKQAHVLPAYFTSEKIRANYQYEHSPMETKGMVLHLLSVWSSRICSVFWLSEPTRHSRNLATCLLSLKKKKKKRIFKKLYFYLWLSLRKGNGFYKQMLEIIIVLLQLYSTCAPPLRNLCIRQSSRIKVVAAFQQRKRPPGK